ncbi:MAG TPA: TonB family protein, partial [Spirochaetales bacterium]|nr:TonB family protein [Spirochaetales bacterium]
DPGAVDVEAAGEAAREAAVMARIQAAKAYPDAARRRGIEGEVVVAFAIAADGSLLRVDAEPGPSHVLLEKAARDAIARAAPFPPGDVGPTEYRVTIVYKLER